MLETIKSQEKKKANSAMDYIWSVHFFMIGWLRFNPHSVESPFRFDGRFLVKL